MTPSQIDLFNAISKPLAVNRNDLLTFPDYEEATKWDTFRNSTPTRETKMAAAKPVINIHWYINYIQQCISASVTPINKISTAISNFPGPGSK
jgi:hypothetical protein